MKKILIRFVALALLIAFGGRLASVQAQTPLVTVTYDEASKVVTLTSYDLDGTEELESCGNVITLKWEKTADGALVTSFSLPECAFTLFWVDQQWDIQSEYLIALDGWVFLLGLPEPIFTNVIFLPFVGKGGH